jgi:protease-4
LAPLGEIAITGPSAMPIHVKPLLDKLSITADFIHVGAYKGAAEPLTRDAPSKEMEETLGAILDRRYQTMVDIIASERKMDPAAVKALIDEALFPADRALAQKLVDEVTPWEQFRDSVKTPWAKMEIEPDDKDQLQAMMKLARFLGAMPPERPIGDHVAVVYALGDIKDGDGDGVIGARQEIASHTLVSALRAIGADDSVKAVVLRIDSGGGSAQASELIWSALEELKAKKPVVVSMSDVAASGGYYIAAGANKIFAQEDTLTGSIGVVGGHIAPAAALAKLGVNTFPMGRGKHATMLSSFKPWNDEEKKIMQAHMEAVYNVFVSRVAAGRKMTAERVQPLAQGRVWVGTKAKELGLVDEIGGLDAALAEARKLGKVDDAIDVEVYPPAPTLRDLLAGWGQVHVPFGLSTQLDMIDPSVAKVAMRLLDLVESFRTTRIQTIAILPDIQ